MDEQTIQERFEMFLAGLKAKIANGEVVHIYTGAYGYTIGLTTLGHPEVLVCALPPESVATIFNEIATRVRNGETFVAGDKTQIAAIQGDLTFGFRDVPQPLGSVLTIQAYNVYQHDVSVLQLVFPDTQNRLPDDEGVDATMVMRQNLNRYHPNVA